MIAAVVQMTSAGDVDHNLERAGELIERAAKAAAELIILPENFASLQEREDGKDPAAQGLDGPIVQFLRERARRHGVIVVGGSFPEEIPGENRIYNTQVVVDAAGEVLATYRKIHLFDVDVPGARLRESSGAVSGEEIVLVETPLGRLGLSICYDLRFPELYRELARQGADILLVPSAFTVPTGSDHWEVLLRARAIENQAFVLAAGQYGVHNKRRRSYGRSMIIDPWGLVLATAADGEGIAVAELDFETLERTRRQLPALQHRRIGI
jgi:predicted amidohydrolase